MYAILANLNSNVGDSASGQRAVGGARVKVVLVPSGPNIDNSGMFLSLNPEKPPWNHSFHAVTSQTVTLLRKFRRVKTFEVFQKTGSKPGRSSQNKIAENRNPLKSLAVPTGFEPVSPP